VCGLIEPLRSFSAAGIDAGVTVNGLGFASRDDAVVWCDAERANLIAAVGMRARLSIDIPGWPLPLVLAHYYNLRGLWADWIATHEIGLVSADRAGDRYGRARVLLSLGRAHTDLEHFDVAAASYEQAFSLFREMDSDKEALRALANLASLHGTQGMWEKAFAAHTEALAMSRALGDEHSEAVVLGNLGRAAVWLGRLDDGIRYQRQALAMRRRHHDLRGQGVVLHNLGETYWRLGCVDEAVDHYQQALRMRREAGYRLGEARTLSDLGRLYLDRRSNQAARACLTQALQIFEDLNAPEASEVRAWLSGLAGRAALTPG
jgi:tetratricopeptide (TPR) repeat protein